MPYLDNNSKGEYCTHPIRAFPPYSRLYKSRTEGSLDRFLKREPIVCSVRSSFRQRPRKVSGSMKGKVTDFLPRLMAFLLMADIRARPRDSDGLLPLFMLSITYSRFSDGIHDSKERDTAARRRRPVDEILSSCLVCLSEGIFSQLSLLSSIVKWPRLSVSPS